MAIFRIGWNFVSKQTTTFLQYTTHWGLVILAHFYQKVKIAHPAFFRPSVMFSVFTIVRAESVVKECQIKQRAFRFAVGMR